MRSAVAIICYVIALSLGAPDDLSRYEFPLSKGLRLGNVFPTQVRYKRSTESTLIVGGSEATRNQFPHQVSIQIYTYREEYEHRCGGTIYDDMHIITAAHCVRGYHPNSIRVVAGDHDLMVEEGSEQIKDHVNYFFHPSYDPMMYYNDVAIIFLDTPLIFNTAVQPIKFPTLPNLEAAGQALNSGWGSDGSSSIVPKLQFVELAVVPRADCQVMYQGRAIIATGMLCAGAKDALGGSCSGDSGGPLVCKAADGTDYQCGIVSWGMIPCGNPLYPTVFADVANYMNWFNAYLPPQKASDSN